MNDTAIVYRKVQKMFESLGFDTERHYFTFSPFKIEFANEDFNFLNPGLKTAEEISQDYNDKWVFAEIANALNQNKNVWKINSAEKIYDDNRYNWIIKNAQLIDPELLEDEKISYLKAKKVLYKDSEAIGSFDKTEEYIKYNNYRTLIDKLKSDLDAKTVEKNAIGPNDREAFGVWQATYDELMNKIKIVSAEWKINGYKDKIEAAQRTILKTNERDEFFQKWTTHKNDLEYFTKERNSNQVDFFPTFCLPSEIYRADYPGWRKVIIEKEELAILDAEAKQTLGDVYSTFETANINIIKIEFEMMFVQIVRSWFKPDLLERPFWKLSDDDKIVSDGIELQNGILPSYPAQLVFIKNLKYYEADKPSDVSVETAPVINISKMYRFKDMVKLHKEGLKEEVKPIEAEAVKLQSISKKVQPYLMFRANPAILSQITKGGIKANPVAKAQVTPFSKKTIPINPALFHRIEPEKPKPLEPNSFSLTISLVDVDNQPLKEIDLQVKEEQKGIIYQCETTVDGKVVLENLLEGTYSISIRNVMNYVDKHVSFAVTTNTSHSIVLLKRKSPKVIFHLLGVINYQFPKLPNPLSEFNYF